jgi:hypothetical protein
MTLTIDRHARLHEVLASDGQGDLADMILWPALAGLSVGPPGAPIRGCARAYLMLAADVIALERDPSPGGATWRRTVVTLAEAYAAARDLLTQFSDDPEQGASVPVLRQMIGVAERVADWLERAESRQVDDLLPEEVPQQRPTAPQQRTVTAGLRRRPWFGADVDGGNLWQGEVGL